MHIAARCLVLPPENSQIRSLSKRWEFFILTTTWRGLQRNNVFRQTLVAPRKMWPSKLAAYVFFFFFFFFSFTIFLSRVLAVYRRESFKLDWLVDYNIIYDIKKCFCTVSEQHACLCSIWTSQLLDTFYQSDLLLISLCAAPIDLIHACSMEKLFWKISQIFTGRHLCRSLLLI